MTRNGKDNRKRSLLRVPLALLGGLALVVCLLLVFYQPDRPVPTIVPESSSGPAFVVQIVRPRLGLPLGGLLPPQIFGMDDHLGFDSTTEDANVAEVSSERIELSAKDWYLLLVFDGDGYVTSETEVVFNLMFEDRLRRVRCRPGDPPVCTQSTVTLVESNELSGSFDIELTHCADAETGVDLGWPPKPLVLHGSFDRLPIGADTQ